MGVPAPSVSYGSQPSGAYTTGYATAVAPMSYAPQPVPVYGSVYGQPNAYGTSFQDSYNYLYGLGSSYPYDMNIYDR